MLNLHTMVWDIAHHQNIGIAMLITQYSHIIAVFFYLINYVGNICIAYLIVLILNKVKNVGVV